MREFTDKTIIHSNYNLVFMNYELIITFHLWIPDPKDSVDDEIYKNQEIFNFEINLDRVIE